MDLIEANQSCCVDSDFLFSTNQLFLDRCLCEEHRLNERAMENKMDKNKIAKELLRIARMVVAMPTYTFSDISKFCFVIHSNDISEPEHVHVLPRRGNDKEAKVWLFPVKSEWNRGFSEPELNEVLEAVKMKRNYLARKFRQLRKKARHPNRHARVCQFPDTLDGFEKMLEDSLVPSEVMKSHDDFWYFRFDEVDGLEPLIELEELEDGYTLLFQVLDNDFKNRGWMKRYDFQDIQGFRKIEEKLHEYLDELGGAFQE